MVWMKRVACCETLELFWSCLEEKCTSDLEGALLSFLVERRGIRLGNPKEGPKVSAGFFNRVFLTALLVGVVSTGTMQAVTISYVGPGPGNSNTLNAGFGNLPGVSFDYFGSSFGLRGVSNGLNVWNLPDYSGQTALYANSGVVGGIEIKASAGFDVQLTGFRIGSFQNVNRSVEWRIYNSDFSSILAQSGGSVAVGATPLTPSVNVNTGNAGTIYLQWAEAFNVGMNSINVTVSTVGGNEVPEPGSLVMVGLAMAVGISIRRRG
jgi:hypothetical protein